jgi:hypothetical protein
MSRAVYLNMSERTAVAHCETEKIGISSIGKLPTGGIRLVCMSVDGAAQLRRKLKASLMKEDVSEQRRGPGWGFVPRT